MGLAAVQPTVVPVVPVALVALVALVVPVVRVVLVMLLTSSYLPVFFPLAWLLGRSHPDLAPKPRQASVRNSWQVERNRL